MNSTTYLRGQGYEEVARMLLVNEGYDARRVLAIDDSAADLIIGAAEIEVKGSFCHSLKQRKTGYQFKLQTKGHSSIRAEWLVMLVCCSDKPAVPFFIPGIEVVNQKSLSIPSANPHAYNGKWARYRDNWSLLRRFVKEKNGETE